MGGVELCIRIQSLTVWEESRHIARREEIMRARGERQLVGRPEESRQLDAISTSDAAEGMDMSERTYERRHAIGRGIAEETAEVLD